MPRKPFGAGLPRWASGKACPAKATPYDNAVAENFFSCLKCELVHLRGYDSHRTAQTDIFAYIEAFYNTLRPHSAIDRLSPCAFELRLRNAFAA